MKLGMTLNFIWKNKHTRIVKKTLERKSKGEQPCFRNESRPQRLHKLKQGGASIYGQTAPDSETWEESWLPWKLNL